MVPLNRRNALRRGSYCVIVALAGCVGQLQENDDDSNMTDNSGQSPVVDAPSVNMGPGETQTISISIDDTSVFYIQSNDSSIQFDHEDVEFDPEPNSKYLMDPPAWSWDRNRSITVEVPVLSSDNAIAGRHEYIIRTSRSNDWGTADGLDELNSSLFYITIE